MEKNSGGEEERKNTVGEDDIVALMTQHLKQLV